MLLVDPHKTRIASGNYFGSVTEHAVNDTVAPSYNKGDELDRPLSNERHHTRTGKLFLNIKALGAASCFHCGKNHNIGGHHRGIGDYHNQDVAA